MIGLLVRALAERATEIARWEGGFEPTVTGPKLVGGSDGGPTLSDGGSTVEFRLEVFGPVPTTYVVTVSEVRRR